MTETCPPTPTGTRRGTKGWVWDFCVLALAVLSMTVLLALYFGWPLVGGNLPYDHLILIAPPTLLVLGVAAVLWILRYAIPLAQGSARWSWWALAAPGVVIAALAVVAAFPKPGFDEVRPQLEEMAQQIVASPERGRPGFQIGGLEFGRIKQGADGTVYFTEADTSFGSTRGWIYAPHGEPEGYFVSLKKLDGDWYRFEQGT